MTADFTVPPWPELASLRRRVKAQRKELRRLHKEVSGPKSAYWWGFRKGLDAHAETELRGKMNKAFGYKVVWQAEHGSPHPEDRPCHDEVTPEPYIAEAEAEAKCNNLTLDNPPDSDLLQCGMRNHPSIEECRTRAVRSSMPDSEGEAFFNYYEANGWKVGRNPMRAWRSAMANWKKNWQGRGGASSAGGKSLSVSDMRTILGAKEQQAMDLKSRYSADVASGITWNDPDKRKEYFILRSEIKQLRGKIANLV